MNEFFNSKFIKDLQEGKIPPVEITVQDETLVKVFAGSFLTVAAMLITWALVKKFA